MKLHKREIAKRQIDSALEMFFDNKDSLSVITLAGAGEEILGKLLKRDGRIAMIDHIISLDKRLTGNGRDFGVVNKEVNGIRNALKHANDPLEDEIEIDPSHAKAMLSRAVVNYTLYFEDATPLMLKFYEHLQMVYPNVVNELKETFEGQANEFDKTS